MQETEHDRLMKALNAVLPLLDEMLEPEQAEEIKSILSLFAKMVKSLQYHFDAKIALLLLLANKAIAEALQNDEHDDCRDIIAKTRRILDREGYVFDEDDNVVGYREHSMGGFCELP